MLIEDLGIEANQFLGRKRVQVAADGIDGAGDILCRAAGGSLEQHVLDEVGDSVLFGRLAPRTGADPDADGDRAYVRHSLRNHTNAVTERSHLDVPHGTGYGCHGRWG